MPIKKYPRVDSKIQTGLLDFITAEVERNINVTKGEMSKDLLDSIVRVSRVKYTEQFTGNIEASTLERIITNVVVDSLFQKALKKRTKEVNYKRVVKRFENKYRNDITKLGLEFGTEKMEKRVKFLIEEETKSYLDSANIDSGKVLQDEGKKMFKTWVHGMYRSPKDPRTSHLEANGTMIPINDLFSIDGEQVNTPREFSDVGSNIYCGCGVEISEIT